MRITMIVIMFLLLGAFFIISNDNLHIGRSDELYKFGEKYYSWLLGLGKNVGSVSGYVVKFEWLPDKISSSE